MVPGSWFSVWHHNLTKLEGICKKDQTDFASLIGVFFYFLGPRLTLVPGVFSYLSVYCFSSTLIGPKNLIFGMPPYFDPTRSKKEFNTQGTRAGPGFHDWTLALKNTHRWSQLFFDLLHIASSWVKIGWLTENLFPETTQSGLKSLHIERQQKRKENSLGTRVGPGFHDRKKSPENQLMIFFTYIF